MSIKKAWSFSSIKDFEGCPRRYHKVKVLKTYPFTDTVHTLYGKEVHKAFEEYVRDNKALPEGLTKHQPVLDKLKSIEGQKLCEFDLAVATDLIPTNFRANDVWVRGIIDLLIVDDDKAFICDYKTGSAKYPDKDQLELMALMVFEHFPQVKHIKAALLFVTHNVLVKSIYKRDNKDKLWERWKGKSLLLDTAFETDTWHPKPSPLCGWCVVEECEHHVRR